MEDNTLREHYQYLIIGGGLAGYLFAYQLHKNNKTFLVSDPGKKYTSSKVAAGMFNPVSGKRMTVKRDMNDLLNALHNTFTELEILLNCKLIYHRPIQQVFGNNKEANDFSARLDDENFKKFVDPTQACEPYLNAPVGCFEIHGGGWVDTPKFIEAFTVFLLNQNKLQQKETDYSKLVQTGTTWSYDDMNFDTLICCEGYNAIYNPFFKWLPFKLCKGQLLLIYCAGLNQNKIVKKGVYLIHRGNDYYLAGATYEWDDTDEHFNETGLHILTEKLQNMLTLTFKVIEQYAGIRPTTRDRNAILGQHPEHKNIFVLNGLGTKGVLQGPFLAQHLFNHIEHQTPIDKEVDIARFKSFYLALCCL